jgi:AraC-like DNA-binding protein
MWTALRDAIRRHARAGAGDDAGDFVTRTPIPQLALICAPEQTEPRNRLYEASICLVIQGAKRVLLGDAVIDTRAGELAVVSVDVPVVARITRASAREPYCAMVIRLDPGLLRAVIDDLPVRPPVPAAVDEALGLASAPAASEVVDCAARLLHLLDRPAAVPVLAPGILRELYYWMLQSPHGATLARIAVPRGPTERIARAIHAIRQALDRPAPISRLAAIAHMSPSSFHAHFKAVTAMTPLQYHKRLRLLEARRLLLAEQASASDAGYRVGYESASQFSREYARMFGAPPSRDAARLRAIA